jgi:DNA-binding transcriptional ArsR family regulator
MVSSNVPQISLEERARVFAALSDPTRLRLVELLAEEDELCGTHIATRAGISMALLSHHWRVLSDAGLVVKQRRGQRQYCHLDRDALAAAFELVWPQRRLRSDVRGQDQGRESHQDALGESVP